MLHETGQIAEADVDYLDTFVLRQLDDFCSGAILHVSSLVRPKGATVNGLTARAWCLSVSAPLLNC